MDGVWRTRVGYAGGTLDQPTYHLLGDHTEVFQVDFVPERVRYEQLLEIVWQSHDPFRLAPRIQYAPLILAHDEVQLAAARASAARLEARSGRRVLTRIERLDRFWLAEPYHQKWYLRNDPVLWAQFMRHYGGDEDAIRESTAAMRANAMAAGLARARCPVR